MEKIDKLLSELADKTAEPVRPGLAEDIKHQIPQRLDPRKTGMDTIKIVIDLRVNKLAAVAAIFIAIVLSASIFSNRYGTGDGVIKDSKFLVKHLLGGADTGRSEVLVTSLNYYEFLRSQGKDVIYYGDSIDLKDSNSVLMQWRLNDGRYGVLFTDFHTRTIDAEELIKLQAQMLQKKSK